MVHWQQRALSFAALLATIHQYPVPIHHECAVLSVFYWLALVKRITPNYMYSQSLPSPFSGEQCCGSADLQKVHRQ